MNNLEEKNSVSGQKFVGCGNGPCVLVVIVLWLMIVRFVDGVGAVRREKFGWTCKLMDEIWPVSNLWPLLADTMGSRPGTEATWLQTKVEFRGRGLRGFQRVKMDFM